MVSCSPGPCDGDGDLLLNSMAQLLLDRGADNNGLDQYGVTPLLFAVDTRHAGLVELFLVRGANVLARDTAGRNILHAAINSSSEVMQLIVQRGVLAAFEPNDASDLCYSAGRLADNRAEAALLK